MRRTSVSIQKASQHYSPFMYLSLAIGIIDVGYVSYLYFTSSLPFYTLSAFVNCGNVLRSAYATPLGIPLAFIALLHYFLVLFFYWKSLQTDAVKWKQLLFWQTAIGVIGALYEVYLQFGVIKSVCGYVFLGIVLNIIQYYVVRKQFQQEHKEFRAYKKALFNKYILNRFRDDKNSSTKPRIRAKK